MRSNRNEWFPFSRAPTKSFGQARQRGKRCHTLQSTYSCFYFTSGGPNLASIILLGSVGCKGRPYKGVGEPEAGISRNGLRASGVLREASGRHSAFGAHLSLLHRLLLSWNCCSGVVHLWLQPSCKIVAARRDYSSLMQWLDSLVWCDQLQLTAVRSWGKPWSEYRACYYWSMLLMKHAVIEACYYWCMLLLKHAVIEACY